MSKCAKSHYNFTCSTHRKKKKKISPKNIFENNNFIKYKTVSTYTYIYI